MHPDIYTDTVEIQSDNILIPAYVAHPVEGREKPIVVVIQEVFGVNEHIKDVTERIAQQGYIGIAPHIYHRQVQGFAVGYQPEDLALGRQYKMGTQAAELLHDVEGAIAYGQQTFNSPPQVGCIGFCFGGHVAYLAATLPQVKATASFYGAGIVSSIPGGGPPTLTRTPDIKGVVYGFFGIEDPLIPASDVDAIEAALVAAAVDHRIVRYPDAGHGFFCDRRESYHAAAAADAWQQVKALFDQQLK